MAADRLPERRKAWLLAAPVVLTIVIFMALPMLIALFYSFLTSSPYGGVERPYTTASYVRFLYNRDLDDTLVFDTTYLRIFLRSLLQALLTTFACLVIALPTAWYMATRKPAMRRLLVVLITVPFWTNLLIRTYCWVLLLRDQGLINQGLQAVGLTHAPIQFLYTDGAILLGLVYANVPFMVLPIYSALERIDPRMIEAAYDLYADRAAILRTIVWPMAKPGIAAGTMLVLVPSLGAFLAPDILGGGKNLMISGLIQQQFSTSRDWSFGAALSMILMSFVMACLVWIASRRGRLGTVL